MYVCVCVCVFVFYLGLSVMIFGLRQANEVVDDHYQNCFLFKSACIYVKNNNKKKKTVELFDLIRHLYCNNIGILRY